MSLKTRVGRLTVWVEPSGKLQFKAEGDISTGEWLVTMESFKRILMDRATPQQGFNIQGLDLTKGGVLGS